MDFTLKKRLFDRMRDASIALRVSLAYTLYRDQNQREFVIPNGRFELAGVGVCSAGWGYLAELSCIAPMRRPESFLISTDLSANTCPLGKNEARPIPGVMARAWELADIMNRNAPLAVRGTRMAIRKGLGLPVYEAELLAENYRMKVAVTDDAKEGSLAFMEKRAPTWTGT